MDARLRLLQWNRLHQLNQRIILRKPILLFFLNPDRIAMDPVLFATPKNGMKYAGVT